MNTKTKSTWPLIAVFACIVGIQLLVTVVSLDVMAAVRSYVTGESLYSKAQKNAYVHLIDYANHYQEKDYALFLREIAFPIGDRYARESMQSDPIDEKRAYAGFVQGGSNEEDIPGLMRLFRWFNKTPLMTGAIENWTQGDALVEQMRALMERAHARVAKGEMSAPEVLMLKEEARALNDQLTILEINFSTALADAARTTQKLLMGLNFALATLLGASGLLFVRHSARVEAITRLDSLTGLFNRRAIEGVMEHESERLRRTGAPFSLVMMDIDHFKRVNDTHGHPGGDMVLKACALQLMSISRKLDVVGRLGGEEFCVILPGIGLEEAELASERLRVCIEALDIRYDGKVIPITASFGFATCSSSDESAMDLIKRVDAALYRAKEQGRNRVCSAELGSPKVVGIDTKRRRKDAQALAGSAVKKEESGG